MKSQRAAGGVLERLFAIDLRSLAAFRVGVGLVLLADLAVRAGNLEEHYSDAGVLPRADYQRLFLVSPWDWSIHALSGDTGVQTLLFALAGAAALALAVGYRTRLATGVSWFLLASLHARNPMLQFGADHLLRMLLLWSIFLPLGARWSLDAIRGNSWSGGRHLSVASAAILAQMFLLYSFSGVFKLNDEWLGGHALRSAMSMDMFAKSLATELAAAPLLLDMASPLIPLCELSCALLLFVPWATLRFRALALVLISGFHLSVGLLLETGIFQFLSLVALLLFVPGNLWDRLASARPVRSLRARFTPGAADRLGDPAPRGVRADSGSVRTLRHDAAQTLVALLLIYVVSWNVCTLSARTYSRQHLAAWLSETGDGQFRYRLLLPGYAVERMLGHVGWMGRVAQFHQQWNMFEEGGGESDGWHVVIGTLEDGREISLLEAGRPFASSPHSKPDCTSALYPDTRWRTCFRYMMQAGRAHYLLGPVIARSWNRRHPDQRVRELEILYVQEPALPGGDEALHRVTTWFKGPISSADTVTRGGS